jgi:hypothetical protein
MSFGGGRDTYTLEYLIKVTNQGGANGFSQVNTGINQVNKSTQQLGMSQEKLMMIQDKVATSHQKVIQAQQGVTKGMKGLAFGILGITTAGAEFVGMLSMWRQTTTAVAEAQGEVDRALKESGKNSKDYKDATMELAKANRWASMTFRNLMLSMFDMVPFFILTINGIVKLRNAYKTLREAQAEQQAMQAVLQKSNIAVAQSNLLQNSSYLQLSKAQRIAKAEQALMITSNEALALSNTGVTASTVTANGALSTLPVAMGKGTTAGGKLGGAMSKLGGSLTTAGAAVSGFLGKIIKIAAPIGAIIIAVEAWKNNWGGVGDVVNQAGVKIGNIHPILKTTTELLAKVGNSIDRLIHGDFEGLKNIWVGGSKEMADATTEMSEKQQKALEELHQGLEETSVAGAELVTEFVEMDKKARKTFLFEHGIKGGAKSRFTDVAEDLDKLKSTFSNFAEDIKLIRLDESLGEWFNLPDSFYKKIEFTYEDRFRKLGKDIGDKGLQNLADELEKAAKQNKGFEGFKQAVINAVKADPTLMSKLKVFDPEAYNEFKKILDEEAAKLNATVNQSNLGNNAWTKGTILDPNAGETKNVWFGSKKIGSDAGILQPVLDKITQGIEGVVSGLKNIDTAKIGDALRREILDPIVVSLETNAMIIGENILPIITTAINQNIDKGITTESATGGVTGIDWDGLWNKMLEAGKEVDKGGLGTGKATWWTTQVEPRIHNFLEMLTSVENWNRYFEEKKAAFGEIPKLFMAHIENAFTTIVVKPTTDLYVWLSKNIGEPITKAVKQFTDHPIIQGIYKLVTDPIGAIFDLIKYLGNATASTTSSDIKIPDITAILNDKIKTPLEKWWGDVTSSDWFKGIQAFLSGNIAAAATDGFDPHGSGGFEMDMNGTNHTPLGPHGGKVVPTAFTIPKGVKPGDTYQVPKGDGDSLTVTKGSEGEKELIKKGELQTGPFDDMGGAAQTASQAVQKAFSDMHAAVIKVFTDISTVWNTTMTSMATLVNSAVPAMSSVFAVLSTTMNSIGPAIVTVWSATIQSMGTWALSLAQVWGTVGVSISETTNTVTSAVRDTFATTLQDIYDTMVDLATQWSEQGAAMIATSETITSESREMFGTALQDIYDTMVDLGEQWTEIGGEMANSAKDTCKAFRKEFASALQDVYDTMVDLGKQWSKQCNAMGANARSAAKQIKSALNSIPKEIVTVHRIVTVGGKAKGGIMSFAEGGVMSAASGKLLTTYGPQLFKIGDNPGGRESIWAIPHDNPGPTVASIDRMYKPSGGSGGTTIFNGRVSLNISGNEIINDLKLDRRIKMTIGENRDKFG